MSKDNEYKISQLNEQIESLTEERDALLKQEDESYVNLTGKYYISYARCDTYIRLIYVDSWIGGKLHNCFYVTVDGEYREVQQYDKMYEVSSDYLLREREVTEDEYRIIKAQIYIMYNTYREYTTNFAVEFDKIVDLIGEKNETV